MAENSTRTDWVLLLEAALVLLLFGLAIALFFVPAARSSFAPEWWTWILLAVIFFGVLGLDHWRRRRRGRVAMHEAIREAARERQRDEGAPPAA